MVQVVLLVLAHLSMVALTVAEASGVAVRPTVIFVLIDGHPHLLLKPPISLGHCGRLCACYLGERAQEGCCGRGSGLEFCCRPQFDDDQRNGRHESEGRSVRNMIRPVRQGAPVV